MFSAIYGNSSTDGIVRQSPYNVRTNGLRTVPFTDLGTADIRRSRADPTRACLFDDFIGAQQDRWGYGKTERVSGLAVHDHLELGRKLHREMPGFSPRRMRST